MILPLHSVTYHLLFRKTKKLNMLLPFISGTYGILVQGKHASPNVISHLVCVPTTVPQLTGGSLDVRLPSKPKRKAQKKPARPRGGRLNLDNKKPPCRSRGVGVLVAETVGRVFELFHNSLEGCQQCWGQAHAL